MSLVLLVVDGKVIGHGFGIAGALVDKNELVLGEPVDGSILMIFSQDALALGSPALACRGDILGINCLLISPPSFSH